MKLNQKGFGAVEILLTIIAVALITGVGYYVYNSSKSDNKENKSGSSRTVEENSDIEVAENKKIDPYEGWKTYDRNGLTFNYPPGFYVDNSSDNFVEVSSFVPDGKLDCPAAGYDVPKCEVKISILEHSLIPMSIMDGDQKIQT